MKEFTYKICDELGIHARPAGLVVNEAKKYKAALTIYKDEKSADLKKLFAVMALAVKKGDTVRITAEGDDEDDAVTKIEGFFKNNL